ncbi:MAG: DUF885 domain-containing protein [Methanobacteriota archaeon]|nr:MAG: DUF885 domain-containing protein [Euryarchaeota archaeon]
MASPAFDALNERMLHRLFDINPDMATILGRHDPYDHLLPHGGVRRLEDNLALLRDWAQEAKRVSDGEQLSRDQSISMEVLNMTLALQEFALIDYPVWKMNPDAFEQPGWTLFTMLIRNYAPFESRIKGITSRIERLPKYLAQFQERFDDSRAVRPWAEAALEGCDAFPTFLTSIRLISAGKVALDLQEKLEDDCDKCAEIVKSHREWLTGIIDEATDEFALGKEKLAKLLSIRGFDLTPKDMLDIGEDYLAKMRRQRSEIAKRIVPNGDMHIVTKTIRENSASSFDDVIRETVEETQKAMTFISEHSLATLDNYAVLDIYETPEFLRPALPVAALMSPAKFEESQIGAYLMTRPKEASDISALWNRAMITNTTVHEAYPGHFLQCVMSNKMPWMHQLPHMFAMADTMTPPYETGEGWAHYCEEMMYEEGFEATDQAAVAMLDAGIWRACRTIYDVKLHSGMATIEEMADLLAKESNTVISAAREDVIGFSRAPAYPLSYLIGKHLVNELRSRLMNTLGQEFDKKKFHDRLAENGNLPFNIAKRVIWEDLTGRKDY